MAPEQVVVITGAGGGIGKSTALLFLAEGHRVVLSGRSSDRLTRAVDEAGATAEGRALAIPTDVRDPDAVAELFNQARERFGRIDVLFNNAGIFTPASSVEDLPLEQWRDAVDTNLTGTFLATREAFRIMKAQSPRGGRIINNGSISAHVPRPFSAAYTATKHAITGLTRSTALDGRRYNIACGQIDIGNAATDLTAAMGKGVPQADGRILPEPTMHVDHAARAVVHMASLPLDANVQFMTIMATGMPYIGRG
jgi:NAD(P)-dependent dehydrogenase (short-subunit alcohol dehydrogenase family)